MLLAEPSVGETLIRLDCNGQVRPGLAAQWAGDSTGRRWIFTLATPAAAEVASAWRERGPAVRDLGIDSVVALDDRQLSVTLRSTPDSAPRLFADRALAMPTARNASGVHLRIASESDPRDALDRGADLVVTRDPAVVDYVAGRPEFTTFPLPWTRLYALVQPAGARAITALDADSVRRSLAEDVAQAEARPAELPVRWPVQCPRFHRLWAVSPPMAPRIVYPRDDRVARGLAERIVALVSDSVPLTAIGLDPAEFAVALRNQGDRGFVVSLARQAPAPCHELAQLPVGAYVYPIIETRARAIVRRGAPPLTVDWDGTVRVAEP